jgi:4-hydroxybenzoate polyprenyltransferase
VAGQRSPPPGLSWFLAASFFNGIVIEVGRKIRAPADEETGVQTYSVLWGRRGAVGAWLAMMAATAVCAGRAARRIHFVGPVVAAMGAVFLLALIASVGFLRQERSGSGKRFELLAGLWTLVLYLSLGLIPLLCRVMPGH